MKTTKFHLIGIGGIGMSALARLLIADHQEVSGSDLSSKGEADKLRKEGAQIYEVHDMENIQQKETTVIYSSAIDEQNPELIKAKSLQCTLWHRSDLLNYLMTPHQSLAIAGTHGKTTTSALLTHVLIMANQSPSYVLGGLLRPQNQNSQKGTGPYFVLEADESDGTLIRYHPSGSILTNIEEDHLGTYFHDLEQIKKNFEQYIEQVKDENLFFWCQDCPQLNSINPKGWSYGFHPESDLKILFFQQKGWHSFFTFEFNQKRYENIELAMAGKHNILNASAVFGLCLQLGIDSQTIREAFKSFQGIQRRSEKLGVCQQIEFIDDYAHHPTEVEMVLKSIRKAFPKRRVITVFQPHRYSRFQHFQKEFSKGFKKSSEVFLTDIYAAGEKPTSYFDLKKYAREIEVTSLVPTRYIPQNELLNALLQEIKPHDVVLTLGAGDITYLGREALKRLQEKPVKLKVGLICGSRSLEHYISLISKKFFLQNLDLNLYDPLVFRIELNGHWTMEEGLEASHEVLSTKVYEALQSCDLLLPIVHGPQGEDGMLQGFLQTLKKPYIGPDYMTCSLTMNKIWTKAIVEKLGFLVAPSIFFSKREWALDPKKCLQKVELFSPYPLVVKPPSLGSSIAISFVSDIKELKNAIEAVFEIEESVLIEEKIKGREFEIAVLEGEVLICPRPGEIPSKSKFYDYLSKYSSQPLQKIVEADLPKKIIEKSQQMAKKIYDAVQGKGFLRIDFFMNAKGDLIFNEANPIPGCTPNSLFPRMLKAHGLSGQEILDKMIIHGLYKERLNTQKNLKSEQMVQQLKHVTE